MADCKGFVTVGEYEDGRPGEIFLRVSKQGSTLAGIMDAFAISISHGLQYGVPLRAFVEAFTNMRFEPAGMTDDPDIRFAELADRLPVPPAGGRVPPLDERAELGILVGRRADAADAAGRRGDGRRDRRRASTMIPDPKTIPSASELATQIELGLASEAPITGQIPVTPSAPPAASRPRASERRADLHAVRGADEPGRQLLRLPELRQHQRLLVATPSAGIGHSGAAECPE